MIQILNRRLLIRIALVYLALIGGCFQHESPTEADITSEYALFRLVADLSNTNISAIVVEVTATDIPAALVFNLEVENSVGRGTISVPAGSDRTITVHAFDANGIETHRGMETVDVVAGNNVTLSIVLLPLVGDVPIEVVIGSISVTVQPSERTLVVSEMISLTAIITDGDGNAIQQDVHWGSSQPLVATVDSDGNVKAVGEGTTIIAANVGNMRGFATIQVLSNVANGSCASFVSLPPVGSNRIMIDPVGVLTNDCYQIIATETDDTCSACDFFGLDEEFQVRVTVAVAEEFGSGRVRFCTGKSLETVNDSCQPVLAGQTESWIWTFDGDCSSVDSDTTYYRITIDRPPPPTFEGAPYSLSYRLTPGCF